MNEKQMRWLMWWWRVVGASYVAGFLTLLPVGAVIVFWAALLFTPLLIVTLRATRSSLIAYVGVPVVAAALFASFYLVFALRSSELPRTVAFQAVWFMASLGPFVLYPIATRQLSNNLKSLAVPKGKDI